MCTKAGPGPDQPRPAVVTDKQRAQQIQDTVEALTTEVTWLAHTTPVTKCDPQLSDFEAYLKATQMRLAKLQEMIQPWHTFRIS